MRLTYPIAITEGEPELPALERQLRARRTARARAAAAPAQERPGAQPLAVQLARWTRRVPSSMKNKTWTVLRMRVSIVKTSQARMVPRCGRGSGASRCPGAAARARVQRCVA